MTSRRKFVCSAGTAVAAILLRKLSLATKPQDEMLSPLIYPIFEAVYSPRVQGFLPPTGDEKEKVTKIVNATPTGPRPIDVAQYFVDRFFVHDPMVISQWPAPQPWNPLIVQFFSATSSPANNDTVPWCAAFANWCLKRSNRPFTNSASSQTFLATTMFETIDAPSEGDLVVFTCYRKDNGESLNLGHVAFFKKKNDDLTFDVVGGNQSGTSPSMICLKTYPYAPFESRRMVGKKYVPVLYKINKYLKVT
ncbi:CHAP domain-containing protein [Trinickia symbiotica]|nr:CHAP domain-containing protein [Trinickia symbiotica]